MFRINKYLIAICVLQLTSTAFGLLYPQYGIFYDQPGCFGEGYEYTFDSVQNPTGLMKNPVSVAFRGAWMEWYEEGGWSFGSDPEGLQCLTNIGQPLAILEAIKLVDSDMDESAITLFDDMSNLTVVTSRVQSNQTEFYLPIPKTFENVYFTGIKPYTIFPESNFTGIETCLEPKTDNYKYGVSGFDLSTVIVGSVRLGCSGKQSLTMKAEVDESSDAVVILPEGRSETVQRIDSTSRFKITSKDGGKAEAKFGSFISKH